MATFFFLVGWIDGHGHGIAWRKIPKILICEPPFSFLLYTSYLLLALMVDHGPDT